jgi:flagellar biogenesis protein FliO
LYASGPLCLLALLPACILADFAGAADTWEAPQSVVTADFLEHHAVEPPVLPADPAASPARMPIRRSGGEQETDFGPSPRSSPVATLAMLGMILGAAYVVLTWLKRRGPEARTTVPDAIDVLCSRRIDGQTTMHLVRIGRRVLALGSTATQVQTLAVIEDPEEVAALVINRGAESPVEAQRFRRWIGGGRILARRAAGQGEPGPCEERAVSAPGADISPGRPT